MSVIFWSLDKTQIPNPKSENNNGDLSYLDMLYEKLLITNGLFFLIIFQVLLGGNNNIIGCTGSDLVGWAAKAAALVG